MITHAGQGFWMASIKDHPEISAESLTWGGLRFKLHYALTQHCEAQP